MRFSRRQALAWPNKSSLKAAVSLLLLFVSLSRSATAAVLSGERQLLAKPKCTPQASLAAVRSGKARFQGVNLGGWLVLERWMTPTVWGDPRAPEDQYHTGTTYSDEVSLMLSTTSPASMRNLRTRVKKHRSTYITEKDFKWIASMGLNAVRLPVGYWLMAVTAAEAKPFVEGAYLSVDNAMKWGAKWGVGVIVDIHINNLPDWDLFHPPSAPRATKMLKLVAQIMKRWGKQPAFLGIDLCNEPVLTEGVLMRYYDDAIKMIRATNKSCWIWIAPMDPDFDKFLHRYKNLPKVLLDVHRYLPNFTWSQDQSNKWAATTNPAFLRGIISKVKGGKLRPVVGEFAMAGPQFNFTWPSIQDNGRTVEKRITSFWKSQVSNFAKVNGLAGWFIWALNNGADNPIWSLKVATSKNWTGLPIKPVC